MRKIFASVAVAAALMLGTASAASAIDYPSIAAPGSTYSMPIGTSTSFEFGNVPDGTYVFTVTNPATGDSVTFEVTKSPDGTGVMVFDFTAPTSAGVLSASVTGPSGSVWTASIDVTATADSGELAAGSGSGSEGTDGTTTDSGELAAGDSLAATGASNMGLVAIAGGLLVAGAGAVGIVARRRPAASEKADAIV